MGSPPEVNEAVLRTAEGRIRYVTAGRGPPIVLLRTRPTVGVEDPILRWLAGSHRVFSTVVPLPVEPRLSKSLHRGPEVTERWLLSLVEGLGLDRPDVCTEPFLAPTLVGIAEGLEGVLGTILTLQIERSEPPPTTSSE